MATLYKVQIGAYKFKDNSLVMKLLVESAIEKAVKDGRLKEGFSVAAIKEEGLWKVQAGAFTKKDNAENRLRQVRDILGFDQAKIMERVSEEPAPKVITGWDKVRAVLDLIVSAKSPHQMVINILKKHGHTLKWDSAWCSETVVAAFLEAGLVDIIGGYASNAPALKKHAKSLGIWHSGSSGIKAGDIVLYGSGDPNHTEIAIDSVYNISGNYGGTVKKRKRSGRTINGYIRPKYPTSEG